MKQRIRDYEIEAIDDNNYMVSKVSVHKAGKNKGESYMCPVGYYNNLGGAVRTVARLEGNKAPDLNGWIREYERVVEEAHKLLETKSK